MSYQFTCERCGKEFTHPQKPSPDYPPKRYCSRKCMHAPEPPIIQDDGTALIPLHGGKFAIVDVDDLPLVADKRWHISKGGYAARSRVPRVKGLSSVIFMHHVIAGNPEDGLVTDHANRNKLDNRRRNLRHIPQALNVHNSKLSKSNTSGYRGVHHIDPPRKWKAFIKVDGKTRSLGLHYTAEEAARAHDKAAQELLGEFAYLNFPDEHDD